MSDESNIGDDRLSYPTGLVEKFTGAQAEYILQQVTAERAFSLKSSVIAGMRAIQNDWLWANIIEHAIREAEGPPVRAPDFNPYGQWKA